jgi:hypothetical protein
VSTIAAELVRRQVAVIVANTPGAMAVKAATTTIPIVFTAASDPVKIGLVASLSRPAGNVTGVTQLHEVVAPKRLQLAHQLIPTATTMAVLVNPTYLNSETELRDLPVCGQPARSPGVAGFRSGRPSRFSHHCQQRRGCSGRPGGNVNDPHRVHGSD